MRRQSVAFQVFLSIVSSYFTLKLCENFIHQSTPAVSNSLTLLEATDTAQVWFSHQNTLQSIKNINCISNNFKVYVHPDLVKGSHLFKSIFEVLDRLGYITHSFDEHCVIIPGLDSLSRDPLDKDAFDSSFLASLHSSQFYSQRHKWLHAFFNLYSGTFPDYSEMLDFPMNDSVIMKASISYQHYKHWWHISLPLIMQKHPLYISTCSVDTQKSILASFKGKWYTSGTGVEPRNTLKFLHSDDVQVYLSCQHKDQPCHQAVSEQRLYESIDYDGLIARSTFCLVPRGRRLGSFRFIEVLRHGCIPVVLADEWVLPFESVIDWSKCVIRRNESTLFELPHVLRRISLSARRQASAHCKFLWTTYLSSVERIVDTAMQILHDRLFFGVADRPPGVWNNYPGGLMFRSEYSINLHDYPWTWSSTPTTIHGHKPFKVSSLWTTSTCAEVNHVAVAFMNDECDEATAPNDLCFILLALRQGCPSEQFNAPPKPAEDTFTQNFYVPLGNNALLLDSYWFPHLTPEMLQKSVTDRLSKNADFVFVCSIESFIWKPHTLNEIEMFLSEAQGVLGVQPNSVMYFSIEDSDDSGSLIPPYACLFFHRYWLWFYARFYSASVAISDPCFPTCLGFASLKSSGRRPIGVVARNGLASSGPDLTRRCRDKCRELVNPATTDIPCAFHAQT